MKDATHLLDAYRRAEEFYEPQSCRGQIVSRQYGFDISHNVWLERTFDSSDREVVVRAYEHNPEDRSEEFDYRQPPMLGEEIGVVWRGSDNDDPRP